jgi:acid stress-induced BolA-like protein IbaG/YrbA
MITPEEVKTMIESAFPGAEVTISDMTGTGDHFEIHVVSGEFSGKSLVERHRMVQAPLREALQDGRIHAIQIKTYVAPS